MRMSFSKKFSFLIILSALCVFLSAQNTLPSGFAKIKLGMSVDEVKDLLAKDPAFGYHGDRDVSLLPGENRVLIETDAVSGHVLSFLDRCWFQFFEDKLYIITINLNQTQIDHYSVFTALCKKYGNPNELTPEKSVWENSSVSMTLERPLALKYIDKNVFQKLQKNTAAESSVSEMTQEMFLDGL